jgi:hypothetical protein
MTLKDLVAVSGLPGLYKLVTSRNNGLVVQDIDTGKTKFCSVRKHQFTPLETVAIYTDVDACEMKEVFQKIKDHGAPTPELSSPPKELFKYFAEILPDYDRDQVKISDVKKVIKWYNFLAQRDMLDGSDEEE